MAVDMLVRIGDIYRLSFGVCIVLSYDPVKEWFKVKFLAGNREITTNYSSTYLSKYAIRIA